MEHNTVDINQYNIERFKKIIDTLDRVNNKKAVVKISILLTNVKACYLDELAILTEIKDAFDNSSKTYEEFSATQIRSFSGFYNDLYKSYCNFNKLYDSEDLVELQKHLQDLVALMENQNVLLSTIDPHIKNYTRVSRPLMFEKYKNYYDNVLYSKLKNKIITETNPYNRDVTVLLHSISRISAEVKSYANKEDENDIFKNDFKIDLFATFCSSGYYDFPGSELLKRVRVAGFTKPEFLRMSTQSFDYAYNYSFLFEDFSRVKHEYGYCSTSRDSREDVPLKQISRITEALRPEGFLLMPFYDTKINLKSAEYILKRYKNIQVLNLKIEDLRGFTSGLCLLIAQKKNNNDSNTFNMSEFWELQSMFLFRDSYPAPLNRDYYESNYENDFTEDVLYRKVTLPKKPLEIKIFKGNFINEEIFKSLLDNSQTFAEFNKTLNVNNNKEDNGRPLLPFNIGQIGLVLTSGCLDGEIKNNNYSHLIKGQVIKAKTIEELEENGHIVSTEIATNRVNINLFLPDGRYRSLL